MKVRCNSFKECKNKKCMWYKIQEAKMWMTFMCGTVGRWVSVDTASRKQFPRTHLKVLNNLVSKKENK